MLYKANRKSGVRVGDKKMHFNKEIEGLFKKA